MVDPVAALAGFALLVLLLVVLFWPDRGVVPRVSALLGMSERVRLEDTLKHLYNCEYAGQRATVDSIAGAVEISRGRAAELLNRLEAMDLVQSDSGEPALTEDGRAYALRILRTHRLWERYLADRTGVRASEWHREAERLEHTLTEEQADRLAVSLGNPVYDPHGDPIPTREGEVPPPQGIPLTALSPGEVAVVLHVEDEPPEVYVDLRRKGLNPQVVLKGLESPRGEVRVEVEGRTLRLEPVAAGNVTVKVLPREAVATDAALLTLDRIGSGETAIVTGISPACQGPQRRRLLDLGVVPGTPITAELESASGDPVAYLIRGALIGLRRQQAAWIQVEPQSPSREEVA